MPPMATTGMENGFTDGFQGVKGDGVGIFFGSGGKDRADPQVVRTVLLRLDCLVHRLSRDAQDHLAASQTAHVAGDPVMLVPRECRLHRIGGLQLHCH